MEAPPVSASSPCNCLKNRRVYSGFALFAFHFQPHERECLLLNDITSGSKIKKKPQNHETPDKIRTGSNAASYCHSMVIQFSLIGSGASLIADESL